MNLTQDAMIAFTLPNGDCLEWQRAKQTNGYGAVWDSDTNKQCLAHRAMYQVVYGEIPDGLTIMHTCDNPSCINPNHLVACTHKENMNDRDNKGRLITNVKKAIDANRKLTNDQLRAIQSDMRSSRVIAEEYNVDRSHICKIRRGLVTFA